MAGSGPTVAQIHNHFVIKRPLNQAHKGPVTLEEQIKGLQRYVRWHERQVVVGKTLLGQLLLAQEKETPQPQETAAE